MERKYVDNDTKIAPNSDVNKYGSFLCDLKYVPQAPTIWLITSEEDINTNGI